MWRFFSTSMMVMMWSISKSIGALVDSVLQFWTGLTDIIFWLVLVSHLPRWPVTLCPVRHFDLLSMHDWTSVSHFILTLFLCAAAYSVFFCQVTWHKSESEPHFRGAQHREVVCCSRRLIFKMQHRFRPGMGELRQGSSPAAWRSAFVHPHGRLLLPRGGMLLISLL